MAEIVFFHYFPRNTALHKMDGRLKLLSMVLLSVSATLAATAGDFVFLTVLLFLALYAARLPIRTLLREMRLFAILIALVVVADAFFIPGAPLPYFPIPGVSVEGLLTGLQFAWRLSLVLMVCTVMTGTTSLLTFKNVIEWYLRPVPFVPAAKVATMINLTFVFIPVIFDKYSEMKAAQKARCIESRKNVIKRVVFTAFPLLSQTLRKTDEIVYAMEARCYSEERTKAVFQTKAKDWFLTAFCLLVFLGVVFSK